MKREAAKNFEQFSGLRGTFLRIASVAVLIFVALSFFFFQSTLENNHRSDTRRFASAWAKSMSQRSELRFENEPKDLVSVSRGGKFVWKKEAYQGEKITGKYQDFVIEIGYTNPSKEHYYFSVLVFLSLGLCLLIALHTWFGFLVMAPLRAIQLAAVRAAAGDFTLPIQTEKKDEFGAVALSFNEMFAALDAYQHTLESRLRELESANDSLQSTQISLVRSEKLASIGQLAAGIAHEIGNPLAAVSGYVELLDDGLDEDDQKDVIHRVATQLERIRIIIRGLLDYSRQDGGQLESTSLESCLDQALELAKAMPKSKQVTFDVQMEKAKRVQAVPSQVVQILLNLIMNAIDAFSDEQRERKISFSVIEKNGFSNFSVRDNGEGIHADNLDKIFDPFFTTKEPGQGTGLGLAIVHQMMTAMGGDIFVESDDGATFTLIFPLSASK